MLLIIDDSSEYSREIVIHISLQGKNVNACDCPIYFGLLQ